MFQRRSHSTMLSPFGKVGTQPLLNVIFRLKYFEDWVVFRGVLMALLRMNSSV